MLYEMITFGYTTSREGEQKRRKIKKEKEMNREGILGIGLLDFATFFLCEEY